jgi:hypothetical protein
MFDATTFLGTSFDQPLDTKRIPTPEGEYIGQIGMGDKDMEITSGEKDGRPWAKLDLRIYLTDPSGIIKQATGSDKPMIFHSVMLDLTDSGGFDAGKGKNTKVGKLLEAANKLKPGWKLTDLKGATIKVKVGSRVYNGETYDEVKAVTTP